MSRLAKLGHVGAGLLLLVGCMLEQEVSRPPRIAVEQLLLTQAVEHALHNLTASLSEHAGLLVEVTCLTTVSDGVVLQRAPKRSTTSAQGSLREIEVSDGNAEGSIPRGCRPRRQAPDRPGQHHRRLIRIFGIVYTKDSIAGGRTVATDRIANLAQGYQRSGQNHHSSIIARGERTMPLNKIIGFVAGFGTTFAAVPDLIAMLKRRSSKGMNPTMAAIMGTFQIVWVYYGVLIASRPVIA